jgi:hypothetical protein
MRTASSFVLGWALVRWFCGLLSLEYIKKVKKPSQNQHLSVIIVLTRQTTQATQMTTPTHHNISPLVPHMARREREFTADEARALLPANVTRKTGYLREERGWGCTDQRTKDIKTRMRKKHAILIHNTKVMKYIAKIDEHLQRLLNSQDPAKEALYDEFVIRRELWESRLISVEVQRD